MTPVGQTEIATRLGVPLDTVRKWKHRGVMPEPEWTVGGRPAWNLDTIEEWAIRTHRL